MAGSLIVASGLTINALKAVQCIMEARIVPLMASVKHTVAAIFRAATTLVSGVNGVVMVR